MDRCRFGWDLTTVNGITALPAAEKQVAQLKSERNKQIRKMREEGMTQRQVADAIGVGHVNSGGGTGAESR